MRTPSNRPQVRYPSNYRANFLYQMGKGSIEEAGYEFANGRTEAYRKSWWKILIHRAKKTNASTDQERIERLEAALKRAEALFAAMPEATPHADRKDSIWKLWSDGLTVLREALNPKQP